MSLDKKTVDKLMVPATASGSPEKCPKIHSHKTIWSQNIRGILLHLLHTNTKTIS